MKRARLPCLRATCSPRRVALERLSRARLPVKRKTHDAGNERRRASTTTVSGSRVPRPPPGHHHLLLLFLSSATTRVRSSALSLLSVFAAHLYSARATFSRARDWPAYCRVTRARRAAPRRSSRSHSPPPCDPAWRLRGRPLTSPRAPALARAPATSSTRVLETMASGGFSLRLSLRSLIFGRPRS